MGRPIVACTTWVKEEPKLSLVYLCMYYYYISLHNNREIGPICTKRYNKLGN